jgi:hypothetical protein
MDDMARIMYLSLPRSSPQPPPPLLPVDVRGSPRTMPTTQCSSRLNLSSVSSSPSACEQGLALLLFPGFRVWVWGLGFRV